MRDTARRFLPGQGAPMSIANAGGEFVWASPVRNMAVRRINNSIKKLSFADVQASLFAAGEDDPGVEVCDASLDDWERYVKSEHQQLMPRAMEWRDGKIFIVELPGEVHETAVGRFNGKMADATGTGSQHLWPHGAMYVEGMRLLEPDCSFGPDPRIGAVRPPRLSWGEFHTVKVEIGVTRGWPKLNDKADRWRGYPGVEYILSIRLSPELRVCEYRLDSVANGQFEIPRMPDRTPIVDSTRLTFDSRRLLGLPAHAPIPVGFGAPTLTIDLFELVDEVALVI